MGGILINGIIDIVSDLNEWLLSPFACLLLLISGVYLSIKLRFFQFSNPAKLISYIKSERSVSSSFRSLTLALAGTLGVGNISGVALALSYGGAGAVLWMWFSAGFAMIIKYSEIVLAVYHRDNSGKEVRGGAMYYIKKGLKRKGVASVLAAGFSLFLIFSSLSTGSVIQMSAASEGINYSFGFKKEYVGILTSLVVCFCLIKGKRITDLTVRIIPFACAGFFLISSFIIARNLDSIPSILSYIVKDATSTKSVVGGLGGFVFSRSIRFGVTKGLFSNEAGCGTSTIAHAQSSERSPRIQGVWGIIEVFFDTVILCTLTAFVLLIAYDCNVPKLDGGVKVCIDAYQMLCGDFFSSCLSISIYLFAFATMICWAHYGFECIYFLTKKRYPKYLYLLGYTLSIIYGAIAKAELIWAVADTCICIMMIVNTSCILAMSKTIQDIHNDNKEQKQLYKIKAVSK